MSAALRESARKDAALSRNYVVLTLASCVIATLGLIENSVAVIIGAMIVAPLIEPIQAFAFAALDGDAALVRKSVAKAVVGVLIAVGASWALGTAISVPATGAEVLARTRPNVLDLAIAIAAGAVAGFAKVRPSIGNAIAGTAIAVALMPPLCVVGLALSEGNFSWAKGAALLFGTNFLGIALACMVVYVLAKQFTAHHRVALMTTVVITIVLTFPLVASFYEIVRESRIENEIRHELTVNTVTFQHILLMSARFDWYSKPLTVVLEVSAEQKVTESQVSDLEAFVARRTGQKVHLVFHVLRYDTVTDGKSGSGSPVAP